MSRPREGDGIKRTIRRRGDKLYAYEITSKMKDGKKVTVSKYLGRVDPDTNELMEKIPEKSAEHRRKIAEQRDIKILEDIVIGDYGGVYLLDNIQKRMHLGEDLNACFGGVSKNMIAIAISLIQCNGVFDSVEGMMNRTWTRRYYDIVGTLDSGTLSRMTHEIGTKAECNIEAFFERRVKRGKGLVAWDTTTTGCHSDMDGMAEYVINNKDNEPLKQVKIGLATDMRGVPLMYRQYAGNVSDMDTVKNLANDIRSYGREDTLFVMDRGFCSGWNVRFMLSNDHRFVIPATTSSKAVKRLLTQFNRSKDVVDMEHDGHMYRVWKTELGICEAKGRTKADGDQAYTFTTDEDEDHGSEGIFTAYVCYDSKKFSDEVQSHKMMVNDLLKVAYNIDAKDPVKVFRSKAGKAAKHFDFEADGRRLKISVKQNSESFETNRAGLFVMLSSKDLDWHTVMLAYDARRLTEQVFDRKKGESKRFHTSDKSTMKGREFLLFLDLMMRCEMSAEIREAKLERPMSVESAISMVDCVQAREYNSVRSIREIDRKEREIFKTFNVPIPKEVLTGQLIFDPSAEG